MQTAEKTMRELFEYADVQVNGSNPRDIQVHDDRFYQRVLADSTLGLGESYMEGWWDCAAIDELVNCCLRARLDEKVINNMRLTYQTLRARLFNRQSSARAYQVGVRHYDLGNDLYRAMLDKRLNYTCAYWKDAASLDEAQEAKLDLVCRKIGAREGMRILELGCGFGAFAKYAAEKYGASVLGLTVSKQQVALGMELCKGLPVELRLQDYREVQGQYDAVISIGIMEHIGYKNYHTYMQVADRCLKPDGIAFVHTIGAIQSHKTGEPWSDRYIFPNGMLPSIAQLAKSMEDYFLVEDLHNIGPNYDPTLLAWYANFEKAWPQLKAKYDERFHRMWRYYLLSSAGAFRARRQQVWQMVLTREGTPQPDCRVV